MTSYHAHLESGSYYHIYNRGNNKESIFLDEDNYLYFLTKWKKYLHPFVDTLAYCLMPNHFHFLIKVKPEDNFTKLSTANNLTKSQRLGKIDFSVKVKNVDSFTKLQKFSKAEQQSSDVNKFLENQFKGLFTSYALAFNKQQNRTGSLFQKRFKRVQIEDNENITRLIHYIHHNPIHHGFVQKYENWRYCSYNAITEDRATLIDKQEVLKWFDGKEQFHLFHQEMKYFEGDIYIDNS